MRILRVLDWGVILYVHTLFIVACFSSYNFDGGRVLAQDVPFFYTPSHLSELRSFKSIISTHVPFIFIFK